MRSYSLPFIALVLSAATSCFSLLAGESPTVSVTQIRQVFDNGEHNAFTDLIRYHDRYYLTFRSCPDGHGVNDSASVLILSSEDTQEWHLVHQFSIPQRDPRDPHFLAFQDRLLVYTGTWYADPSGQFDLNQHLGYAVWSHDGRQWSDPKPLEGTFGHYIWKASTYEGRAFLCGRRKTGFAVGPKGEGRAVQSALLESQDGLNWRFRSLFQTEFGDETAFLFEPDGTILAIGRRGSRTAQFLRAAPPYTDWVRKDLDRYIGGPLFIRWGKRLVIGGRKFTESRGPKTFLGWFQAGEIHEFAELPSAGDNSYPGFIALSPTKALISWYSSHETDENGNQTTAIYLAQLQQNER